MYKVSVPGSVMLFGEHAVLHGKNCIVMAIAARLKIEIIPNDDKKIIIYSSLGNDELYVDYLTLELANRGKSNLNYIFSCIEEIHQQDPIKVGFNLIILDGNLKNSAGFGSSAAVIAGVLALIRKFLNLDISVQQIFTQGLKVLHKVQNNIGSGADLAASIHGGISIYKNFQIQKKINQKLELIAIYCGYKTKTVEVIKKINQDLLMHKNLRAVYDHIFLSMDDGAKLAAIAMQELDLITLGKLMNIAHGLLSGLGVVDHNLDQIAMNLRNNANIYGSKLSGAGLGDCVIGLRDLNFDCKNLSKFNLECFELSTSQQGIRWE